MITFVYMFVILTLASVLSLIDVIIYHKPLLWILRVNIILQPGTAQWMVYVILVLGFIYSVGTDYRIRKMKKQSRSS